MATLGLHWFLEGRGADASKLSDPQALAGVLTNVPETLGLTVLTPPSMQAFDGGRVGMVLLAESHFTVRCHDEDGEVFADLFSCRRVDFRTARDQLVDAFGLSEVSVSTVEREFDE